MKFDSELYELTKDISEEKKEYTKEELEFARLILNEFCKKAKEKEPDDGLIRVTFTSKWWSTVDEGYHEINDLLKLRKFNTLFRHYNIYIGDSSYLEDEYHDAYFELIWDYKTYMDGLKTHEMQEKIMEYAVERNKAYNECMKNNDHDFGEWEEKHITKTEKVGSGYLPVGYMKYVRKCKKCGFVQFASEKSEVEAAKIEEEIKTLQRKLDKIKKR